MKIKRASLFLLDNFIWVLLIILIVSASGIPNFFSIRNFSNILYNSTAAGMMTLGMVFCLLVGHLDLSVEATYAFAPSMAVLFMVQWASIPPIAAVILTIIFGVIIGAFNGFISVKLSINPFMLTLCMQIILRGLVLYFIPQGIFGLPDGFTFLGGSKVFGTDIQLAVILFIAIFLIAHFVMKNFAFGKNLIATGSNKNAAYLTGVNTDKVRIIAFILSGTLSAIGGLFMAGRIGSVTNTMGEGAVMTVLASAVLGGVSMNGGKGTVLGAMGGVIFMSAISNVLTMWGFSPFLVSVVQGTLLLAAILFDNAREKLYLAIMRKA
ncbi:MAG: ABC transporter permease [Eubacteriales bacterium]|nr:ABC transporter permease [Eubacteriales bacterium]